MLKNCGQRFHTVVCRYEFINEMIKLVSRKYCSYTTEPVKRRVLGLIQQWKNDIGHPKIQKAYEMLKERGHEFPLDIYDGVAVVQDKSFLRKEEKRRSSFDEEEQNRMLSELLKSKDPRDLVAANALIKEMVHADDLVDETDEKIRRDLDVAENSIRLFSEMLNNWVPADGPLEQNDLVQELLEALHKMKPRVVRLCADLDEAEDLNGVLPVNRHLRAVLKKYDSMLADAAACGGENSRAAESDSKGTAAAQLAEDVLLLDLGSIEPPPRVPPASTGAAEGQSILDDDLAALGLGPSVALPPTLVPMLGYGVPPASISSPTPLAVGQPPQHTSTPANAVPMPRAADNGLGELNTLARAGPNGTSGSPQTAPDSAAPPDLAAVSIKMEDFQSDSRPPIVALDKDGLRMLLFLAANPPHPSLTVVNVSFLNHNNVPIHSLEFEAAVPKTMQVKLQPPTSTSINAFNFLTGPAMVSQIMIILNPTKAPIRLRFKLSYTINSAPVTQRGEVSTFPSV